MGLLGASLLVPRGNAAETFGGSLAVTSDYVVRGISRSNQRAALQADAHVVTDGGLAGGIFASSVQFDEGDHRNAEINPFLGFSWLVSDTWRAKSLVSYYVYAWNDSGSQYNYAELSLVAAFRDWLDLDLYYSPNSPRYVRGRGLTGVSTESAQITVRTPLRHQVAASAGLGYSQVSGPGGGGYPYWSAGGIVDLAPWTVSLSYIDTTAEAALLYSAAAHHQWGVSVIWQY
ncbi:MAG: hypothetical protein NVSMB10_19250 [Steroidobacteraceae bacterium]